MTLTRDTRICIIGAGAGGLTAAHYLTARGYRRVTVLEKAERLGGLCESFTYEGRSYDLGGNYVLPGYSYVRDIADAVGAALITGPDRRSWDSRIKGFRSTLSSVLQGTNFFAFTLAVVRYVMLLIRFRRVLGTPGWDAVHTQPDLCKPMDQFMREHGLEPMRLLFAIPISIMGYGSAGIKGKVSTEHPEYLNEIAAAYVMRYVDFRTLLVLLLVGMGLSNSWPKRFADGYQRFLERVAWSLDVRLGTNVRSVRRDDVVTVESTRVVDGAPVSSTEEFDLLLIACPLGNALGFLDATPDEQTLFSTIAFNEYAVTTAVTTGMPNHIIDVLPLTAYGNPWALVKQWPDRDLCVYYSPVDASVSDDDARAAVVAQVSVIGGQVQSFHDLRRWQYFPHFTTAQMADGFYHRLEALQGQRRTYLLGCAMDFELAERAAQYSNALVDRYFSAPSR